MTKLNWKPVSEDPTILWAGDFEIYIPDKDIKECSLLWKDEVVIFIPSNHPAPVDLAKNIAQELCDVLHKNRKLF